MMTLGAWSVYVLVAGVAVVSPGPATLLAINNSVSGGRRTALISSLGNVTGLGMLSLVATLGLGALLQASATLFTALKIVGALYLVWLGVRQWRGPARLTTAALPTARRDRDIFVEGLLVSLSNPKSIVFFTALFPQFLDHSQPLAGQFALMTGTFMALSIASLTLYAAAAARLRRWLGSAHGERLFGRVCGALFVAIGAGLLSGTARASSRT